MSTEIDFNDPVQFPRRAAARMREELRTKHTSQELERLLAEIERNPELAQVFRLMAK